MKGYINRSITKKAETLLTKFPILTLTGPRQSGKTTLLKTVFSDFKYLSLEDPDVLSYALDDPRGFLNQTDNNLIIDEAQKAPKLFSYLQTLVDDFDNSRKFILSGSQNFLLMQSISQSLAGRVGILELLPLTILELQKAHNFDDNCGPEELIFKGFYPRLHMQAIKPIDYYKTYLSTYIEKDLRQLSQISDLRLFQKFMQLLAGQTGQILNLNSISTQLGISSSTASRWVNLLETSFIIFLLPSYYVNIKKQLLKSPKLYFTDTGLATYLLGMDNSSQVKNHYIYGNLFENLIVIDILKQQYNKGLKANLFYLRNKTGQEIDLILPKFDSLKALEIKAGQTLHTSFWKNLNYWEKQDLPLPMQKYLVYAGNQNQNRYDTKILSWKTANFLE